VLPGRVTTTTTTTATTLQRSQGDIAKLRDKVVVITGALRPERLQDSDAPINVGAALAAAAVMPPGVYVCMHGTVFDADRVERVPTNGCFVVREADEVERDE
jgi:L-asparaginase